MFTEIGMKNGCFLYPSKVLTETPLTRDRLTREKHTNQDFSSGPVVKSPPTSAGDVGSIPGWGTVIFHAVGQLSQHTPTRGKPAHFKEDLACHNRDLMQPNIFFLSKPKKKKACKFVYCKFHVTLETSQGNENLKK